LEKVDRCDELNLRHVAYGAIKPRADH